MLENKFDFFDNESKKYKQILQEYKKDNTKVFVDNNFHPTTKISPETKLIEKNKDLYSPSITWKRIDEVYRAPLFKGNKIHPLYVQQGKLGDCYFISALERVAKKYELVQTLFEKQLPDEILGRVPDSINISCGAVVIYFRVFGRRTPVLIDTLIPFQGSIPFFSRPINTDKSAWFLLVEKAFAKLNGSYSNIISGSFAESFYNLFGYYKKFFTFTVDTSKNTLKLLRYQKCGCLMNAGIPKEDENKKKAAENHNLVTGHSYLLMKIRKHEDMIFFQLRNPWGHKEWTGDYSKNSDLWTPELKKVLHEDQGNGRFWIAEKDFYTHYTHSHVAKPVDPHWTMRYFSFKLPPSKDSGINKLNQHRNFAFKLKKDVPAGTKARVRIVAEKRNTDYDKLRLDDSVLFAYWGRNGNQKLTSHIFYTSDRRNLTLSTKVSSKDDIISFVFVHRTQEEIESDCYVNVFCEFDFDVYDVDHPESLFPKGETRNPVLDNFSITAPNAALVMTRTVVNGKDCLCLKSPTASNFKDASSDPRYDIVIKNLINETKSSPYSLPGPQIDRRKYIFNNDRISIGRASDAYEITERETGKELAAIVSIERMERIFDSFRKKVSIMMQLNHPSIVNFIGFSETDFTENQNPMIITDLYRGGTLEDHISDLTNTKKMINLIGIAFGMKHIHKHNIIHRDLRCSKILLDQNMQPKIGHFSTARINTANNEQYGRSLPYYFLAPEIVDGTKEYSFPVDVFAYGMLFYHVISNKKPTLAHKTKTDFFFKILDFKDDDKRSILDDGSIQQRFRPFICSMWKENPSERPTFEQIINKLLHSRDEIWLENVDTEEVEEYIHQFGETLRNNNQSE